MWNVTACYHTVCVHMVFTGGVLVPEVLTGGCAFLAHHSQLSLQKPVSWEVFGSLGIAHICLECFCLWICMHALLFMDMSCMYSLLGWQLCHFMLILAVTPPPSLSSICFLPPSTCSSHSPTCQRVQEACPKSHQGYQKVCRAADEDT